MACATLLHLSTASILSVYFFILASLPWTPWEEGQVERKLKAKSLSSQAYQMHQLRIVIIIIIINWAAQRKIKVQIIHCNGSLVLKIKWRNTSTAHIPLVSRIMLVASNLFMKSLFSMECSKGSFCW